MSPSLASTSTPAAAQAAAASIADTKRAIDSALKQRGGVFAQYGCKVVSWDDASRGTVDGSLSCWGSNITDTYLTAKNGADLYTVRPENFNEKLGYVSCDELALVCNPSGGPEEGVELVPITLRDFLENIGKHGEYAGLGAADNLLSAELDKKVTIRFQTTFLPVSAVDGDVGVRGERRGTLEFATEAYNYNTTSDAHPRNLVLLCTTQGVAVQQDGRGAQRIFHHVSSARGGTAAATEPNNPEVISALGTISEYGSPPASGQRPGCKIARHWLEAESSAHKVGEAQNETAEEREDAVARGKAVSSVIGIQALGTRFNVLMTVQLPLEQPLPTRAKAAVAGAAAAGAGFQSQSAPQNQSAKSAPEPKCAAAPKTKCEPKCAAAPKAKCEPKCAAAPKTKCAAAPKAAPKGPSKGYKGEGDSKGKGEIMMDSKGKGDMMDCKGKGEKGDDVVEGKGKTGKDGEKGCDVDMADSKGGKGGKACKGPGASKGKDGLYGSSDPSAAAGPGTAAPEPLASAARVSRGSKFDDTWAGLTVKNPKRNSSEHITVTVVIYNAVVGGVPTPADVIAAVEDLEQLYAACNAGSLGSAKFDFAKKELTVADSLKIASKVKTQPPPSPPITQLGSVVRDHAVFPGAAAAAPVSSTSTPAASAGATLDHAAAAPGGAASGCASTTSTATLSVLLPDGLPEEHRKMLARLAPSQSSLDHVHALGHARLQRAVSCLEMVGVVAAKPSKIQLCFEVRKTLKEAVALLQAANAISLNVWSVPLPFALYNIACCFSVSYKVSCSLEEAAEAAAAGSGGGGVGGCSGGAELCVDAEGQPLSFLSAQATEPRHELDAAGSWLVSAVAAGYSDICHLQSDADLAPLHKLRPEVVEVATNLVKLMGKSESMWQACSS